MECYASLETGGTKCVCAIGTAPDNLHDLVSIPTTTPSETIPKILQYFKPKIAKFNITSMGITSFGPIDLNNQSLTYGYITSTPKQEWINTNLVGIMTQELNLNIVFDTDVNGAALAEGMWGSAKGLDSFVYITVGTGIGVGVIINNTPLHGMLHPEGGHILLQPHPDDPSEGFCPYHKNCLEGLASGPTFEKRWNVPARELADDHLGWELEAYYLASGVVNIICLLSPQRIIIGGGISTRTSIFPRIRKKVIQILNKYINTPEIINNIDKYIVPPTLEHSGLMGGILMASQQKLHLY